MRDDPLESIRRQQRQRSPSSPRRRRSNQHTKSKSHIKNDIYPYPKGSMEALRQEKIIRETKEREREKELLSQVYGIRYKYPTDYHEQYNPDATRHVHRHHPYADVRLKRQRLPDR